MTTGSFMLAVEGVTVDYDTQKIMEICLQNKENNGNVFAK